MAVLAGGLATAVPFGGSTQVVGFIQVIPRGLWRDLVEGALERVAAEPPDSFVCAELNQL